mmetsp:Transcript_10601/g.24927  ORF Transcript_10601/g.24927 Transcript_10601/m.24927 type:complete len:235 (+) Transcript_10601:2006-2710(+)
MAAARSVPAAAPVVAVVPVPAEAEGPTAPSSAVAVFVVLIFFVVVLVRIARIAQGPAGRRRSDLHSLRPSALVQVLEFRQGAEAVHRPLPVHGQGRTSPAAAWCRLLPAGRSRGRGGRREAAQIRRRCEAAAHAHGAGQGGYSQRTTEAPHVGAHYNFDSIRFDSIQRREKYLPLGFQNRSGAEPSFSNKFYRRTTVGRHACKLEALQMSTRCATFANNVFGARIRDFYVCRDI